MSSARLQHLFQIMPEMKQKNFAVLPAVRVMPGCHKLIENGGRIRKVEISGKEDRKDLPFHKAILNRELPYSIGGGIGQSRLCMFFLRKAHIGEVQVSVWPEDMDSKCREHNIFLL